MTDPDAYCRELEAYLCRKNDGHLIRIVGPAFDRVRGWAAQGIPVTVAEAGIDRYFLRYYRKGPRRRPVRIEFCEADVLDAFDEWRRAVGISVVAADPEGGLLVEEPAAAAARPRRSLRSHLDSLMARLTVLRGSDKLSGVHDAALERAIRALEPLRQQAGQARGDERQALVQRLEAIGADLLCVMAEAVPAPERESLAAEAARELEPFRARMPADAYRQARDAAVARLVRLRYGLPEFSF